MRRPGPEMPRVFHLERNVDISGVSGTGVVAHGTVYPNGKVTLVWNGSPASASVFDSLSDVETVHGHHGCTRIVFYPTSVADPSRGGDP